MGSLPFKADARVADIHGIKELEIKGRDCLNHFLLSKNYRQNIRKLFPKHYI